MGDQKRAPQHAVAAANHHEEPGLLDQAAGMGNSFMQSVLGLAHDAGEAIADTDAPQGYMHSPWLHRWLTGEEPEPRHQDLDVSFDSSQPWSEDGLRRRIGYEYNDQEGNSLVGDDELVNLMGTLSQEAPGPDASPEEQEIWRQGQKDAAIRLGELRGRSPEDSMKDYDRYRDLQREQRERAEREGLEVPEALDAENAAHMGSIQQLRYGSYVGEALGVDAVYGALLNPTGGLVGEGNAGYSADPDSVASYHGEAHDAFGYLRNYHEVGPGYMYASPDEARRYGGSDPGELGPYTGQASGFQKWNDLLAERGLEDPDNPGDVDAQMRESLSRLGHGGLVDEDLADPIRVGWNPTPGFPDDNPTVPSPLESIPRVVETVEDIIHAIGDFDPTDILA